MRSWIQSACAELIQMKADMPGWGYHPGSEPYVEPTVLCSLALLAAQPAPEVNRIAREARAWLVSIQQPDGSLGLAASLPHPNWTTAYAIMLWALDDRYKPQQDKAVNWLLRQQGLSVRDTAGVMGHDGTIPGWSWTAQTHSWVEPTSLAVLALKRHGLINNVRVKDGLRMLRNRPVATGGWNYGNSSVLGTDLRAMPQQTGIALLALSGTQARDSVIENAVAYLARTVPELRVPQSLGWALLGLAAWGAKPDAAPEWIESCYSSLSGMRNVCYQLAHLLLAVSDNSLQLLGIRPPSGGKI